MYRKRNDELKVLSLYLGNYTKQLYLREISRLANIPLKTTQNTVAVLEANKILRGMIHGKNKYFKLNLDNAQTKLCILQAEVYRTTYFLQKYSHFKTFLKSLSTNAIVVIFGSFAKFVAGKDSDADLLVIAKTEEKLPVHLLPYKVHDIRMSEDTFIKAIEKQETLLKEIEENHIILSNHSFYIRVMWDYYGQ